MNDTRIGDRAVVLGASLAGLLAARVLSDSYAQVTVVERDELPERPSAPARRPARRHIHGSDGERPAGPGGAVPRVHRRTGRRKACPSVDLLADARFYLSGHRLRPGTQRTVLLCASRPLLEGHLRARMRDPARTCGSSTAATSSVWSTTPDGDRVTGVRVIRIVPTGAPRRLLERRPGRRRHRPRLSYAGMAGRAGLSPRPEQRADPDRAGLRQPDLGLPPGTLGR